MFNKVFIEKDIQDHILTKTIISKIKYKEQYLIDSYADIWGRARKPYLEKRDNLNLFIATKKGQKIKEAPPAYGHGDEKHYYFIHSYNCIYECEYCYLQGHFTSPDLVFFVNHDEIIREMADIVKNDPHVWFHAGEFSDSLALSHITGELPLYFEFFKKYPNAKLELRTKSLNIKELEKLKALPNIIVSFTMSSHHAGKIFDYKCPSVKHRIIAIKKLVENGYQIGLHFDPIIYHEDFEEGYLEVINELGNILPNNQLQYISLGVVRFTKDIYHDVKNNYPESKILKQDFTKSFDGKMRYNAPMRMWMMQKVKQMLINHYDIDKIYFCMEEDL